MATYATWNPSDKSANTTLSNGDLTATHAVVGSGYNGVRSTINKTTGKWYWEYSGFTIGGDNAIFVGLGTASASLTNGGANTGKYMYLTQGCKEDNGTETCGFATWGAADVIGVAYDADANTAEFFKNNVSQFTLTSMTNGLYAILNFFNDSDAVTANFGATSLTYTPPTGFNAGLYEEDAT